MEMISFKEMMDELTSGRAVKIQYCTYSETRNKGGDLITISCRKVKGKAKKKPATISKGQSGWKDNIIRMNLELVANDIPTDQFRMVYPLFITKINNQEVRIA